MSSTLTDLTAATTWSGTDLFYALVGGNSRQIAASKFLVGEAAGVLSAVDSTTAQTFRVYRTFTDSSNYERLALQSGSGYMELAAQTAGTGTDNLDIRLTPAGTGSVFCQINSSAAQNHIVIRNSTSDGQTRIQYFSDSGVTSTDGAAMFFVGSTGGAPFTNAFGIWNYENGPIMFAVNNTERLRVDTTATATQTALLVYDVDNATLERVSVGVADSGGIRVQIAKDT